MQIKCSKLIEILIGEKRLCHNIIFAIVNAINCTGGNKVTTEPMVPRGKV